MNLEFGGDWWELPYKLYIVKKWTLNSRFALAACEQVFMIFGRGFILPYT